MFKKVFYFLAGFLISSAAVHAQSLEILTNPVYDTTGGVTPYVPGSDGGHAYVELKTFVKNNTSDSVLIEWKNLSTDTTQNPEGWILTGVCDNINCRSEYGDWYYGAWESAKKIGPGENMLLLVHIYAPTTSADTTGIYKILLQIPNFSDTAVFVLNKNSSTGISMITGDDERVNIYPNPVMNSDQLHVFVDKNLRAKEAVIYNIIGKKQMEMPVSTTSELNIYDVHRLPAGIYMFHLTDENGQVITSRKFSKR